MTTGKDMVFIQVEVGAISASSDLARAAGMSEDSALAGLVRFWHCCIRDHRRIAEFQHVSDDALRTLVASSWGREVDIGTLELLGFIRKVDKPNQWRIRGLSRYIEAEKRRTAVFEARSNAGSASVRRRFEKYGSAQPIKRTNHEQRSNKPRTDPEQTPNLDVRRNTGDEIEDISKTSASSAKNADSARRTSLSDALCSEYQRVKGVKYIFAGAKDSKALTRLLKMPISEPELVGLFGKGLVASGFANTATIAELSMPEKLSRLRGQDPQQNQFKSRQAKPSEGTWEQTGEVRAVKVQL